MPAILILLHCYYQSYILFLCVMTTRATTMRSVKAVIQARKCHMTASDRDSTPRSYRSKSPLFLTLASSESSMSSRSPFVLFCGIVTDIAVSR